MIAYGIRGRGGAPTTARLRGVLDRAACVVISEGMPDVAEAVGVPRIVVSGAEIADLARLPAIVDGGTGDRCRCPGSPTILLRDGHGELIARWTLHHRIGLRSIGACDAELRDGPALTAWLAERGPTGSREVQTGLAAWEAAWHQRRERWLQAAPAGMRDAATDISEPPEPDWKAWRVRLCDAEARLAVLVRDRYPDEVERILVLAAWAGALVRESAGGRAWYEEAVEKLLVTEDPGLVVAALAFGSPNAAQLDGAAILFASFAWTAANGTDLPEPLRSTLVGHVRAEGTDRMRFWVRHGYYGAEPAA
ncbi:MAG: hypothetical protein HOV66_02820 [Streptomycetaceae bacterium]|nr:hypothetical protein [Streptomycetaceae bacterium]